MSGMKKILGLAGAALLAGTVAASAATVLSIENGTATALNDKFNPSVDNVSNGNDLAGLGLVNGTPITAFDTAVAGGAIGGGLKVSGFSKITVTFLGKEAGATDYFVETVGMQNIRNKISEVGTSVSFTQGAGFVKFLFSTLFPTPVGAVITNGGTASDVDVGLAFGALFNNDQSVYAFFDDGSPDGTPDEDYDDMVVRIDVQAIPLPAGGLLLLTGLAGLAAARRRKV